MCFEIKVGSVTNAQRAMKILKSKKYRPVLSRIKDPDPLDGCGYVIKVCSENDNAVKLLQNAEIKIIGVEQL